MKIAEISHPVPCSTPRWRPLLCTQEVLSDVIIPAEVYGNDESAGQRAKKTFSKHQREAAVPAELEHVFDT
jgi:hypothetical protein